MITTRQTASGYVVAVTIPGLHLEALAWVECDVDSADARHLYAAARGEAQAELRRSWRREVVR